LNELSLTDQRDPLPKAGFYADGLRLLEPAADAGPRLGRDRGPATGFSGVDRGGVSL
jgi:hypothetical protein